MGLYSDCAAEDAFAAPKRGVVWCREERSGGHGTD